MRMFNIQPSDIVCFKHVEDKMEEDVPDQVDEEQEDDEDIEEAHNNFEVTMYRVVDNKKEKKDIVLATGNIVKHNFISCSES